MSGTPSQAEIQTQWKNAVAILEDTREFADGTIAGAGGYLDTLLQSLEGEYTPAGLAGAAQSFRDGLAVLAEQPMALQFLSPILYEYARIITSGGAGYTDLRDIMRALWEWFDDQSLTVNSRDITYAAASYGGGNIGNGKLGRLTVDEGAYDLEACHVEKKEFRCRRDMNSGVKEEAEEFEVLGQPTSQDGLLRGSFGSGITSRILMRSSHAGSGPGGSLLRNGAFSTYSASATPKFSGWTETSGGAEISQDTTNYYRGAPGVTTPAGLKIGVTGGGGGNATVTLTQTLDTVRGQKLDPNTPYFLRVMLNKTIGSAVGGTVNLRLGSQTATVTIAALAANWAELLIPLDENCWFRNFNEADLSVEIEWAQSSSTGYLLMSDVILVPLTQIDGTYWVIRGNTSSHTAWLVDDTFTVTDTGGAAGTGKIQWWLWVAGLGYLPSATGGGETFTDPA